MATPDDQCKPRHILKPAETISLRLGGIGPSDSPYLAPTTSTIIIREQETPFMNPNLLPSAATPSPHVEFFRLPQPGKRDPHFGLSRSWYYKAAASGEIKMVSVRQRNALRGVRLIVYDSVTAYIRRAGAAETPAIVQTPSNGQ